MRIVEIEPQPLHEIPYHYLASEGLVKVSVLKVTRVRVSGLPAALDGLLAAADLQGYESAAPDGGPGRLLGERLCDEVVALSELGQAPLLSRMGVLLAGDLFARPEMDRRGGLGDVRGVWHSFSARFRFVAGVAGNHDSFGPRKLDLEEFRREPGITYLDGNVVDLDGLRIEGVSGVIGPPERPFRRTEEIYCGMLRSVLAKGPHIVLMHDGPSIPEMKLLGVEMIRQVLEETRPTLVIRGHKFWEPPLASLANGGQVLSADARAWLLVRE